MNDFIVTILKRTISIDLCIIYGYGYGPDFITLNSEKIFMRYRAGQAYFCEINQFIIFNEYPEDLLKVICKELE